MSFSFKNFGHAIASGAKHFEEYAKDAVSFLAKVQGAKPAVELVASAVSPKAADYADLAFRVLGDYAAAVEKVSSAGTDLNTAVSSGGLNVPADIATVQAVKEAIEVIKSLIAARGAVVPSH
jgi:hypothetical protein